MFDFETYSIIAAVSVPVCVHCHILHAIATYFFVNEFNAVLSILCILVSLHKYFLQSDAKTYPIHVGI